MSDRDLMSHFGSIGLLGHFLGQSGEALTLSQLGLQDDVQKMVKTKGELGKDIQHSLHGDFLNQILQGSKSFHNGYKLGGFPLSMRWAIGGVTISGEFFGDVVEQRGRYYLIGTVHYSLLDHFSDVWDTLNLTPDDHNNFGGEPFNITGNWVEPVNESISKAQYERLKAQWKTPY
ncbi:hypothetical protein PHA51_00950 [Rodentibacter pneumotropicus]|uniref:Uncharacterized protein n=1 Tax=Rodentibacter pneumotropicus TaxID=758 RepID=A0A4V6RIA2_9PAST|nr:hypothetical protein [Rodentibacter pneumotropicus]MDC2824607.1 hypothetical protein [Rodentibacter pneumotropicus]THA11336.1 hypothetical protein D3M78_00530 [Rodentibacter pneumotropicus]